MKWKSAEEWGAHNFEENITGRILLTLLDLPLSDTTFGHSRAHRWHSKLGQRISARRGVYF